VSGLPDRIARLRIDPDRRQAPVRWGGITIGGIMAFSAVLTILAFIFAPDLASGIGFATLVLTGATLLLAVIAAAVAILAYALSIATPDLAVRVRFPFSQANNPVFDAEQLEDGSVKATSFKQLDMVLDLRNRSEYSARDAAVIIRFNGMAFFSKLDPEQWVITDFASTVGITAIQWGCRA